MVSIIGYKSWEPCYINRFPTIEEACPYGPEDVYDYGYAPSPEEMLLDYDAPDADETQAALGVYMNLLSRDIDKVHGVDEMYRSYSEEVARHEQHCVHDSEDEADDNFLEHVELELHINP